MINIDPSLLASIGALFLVMLYLVNKMLVSPVMNHIDSREKSIKEGLAKAGGDTQEVSDLEAKAAQIIHEAKQAAHTLREEKLAQARAEVEEKIALKKQEIDQEIASFQEELEAQKIELKNSLLGQAPLFRESLKVKLLQHQVKG